MRQWLSDWCEMRMHRAAEQCDKRARKYGDKSWPWKLAIQREIFWFKLGYKILGI